MSKSGFNKNGLSLDMKNNIRYVQTVLLEHIVSGTKSNGRITSKTKKKSWKKSDR